MWSMKQNEKGQYILIDPQGKEIFGSYSKSTIESMVAFRNGWK